MDKQQLIAKYGKLFAASNPVSPSVLDGVHYSADGCVSVTNRHYGLHIKEAHQFEKPLTLNAKTGTPAEGVYPDITRAFPQSFDSEIQISSEELTHVLLSASCAYEVAKRLDKKIPVVMLTAVNGMTYLQISNKTQPLEFSAHIGNTEELKESKRSMNAGYLHTTLSLFKDAESKLISIKLKDRFDPIVVEDEKQGIRVVLLPYRTQ